MYVNPGMMLMMKPSLRYRLRIRAANKAAQGERNLLRKFPAQHKTRSVQLGLARVTETGQIVPTVAGTQRLQRLRDTLWLKKNKNTPVAKGSNLVQRGLARVNEAGKLVPTQRGRDSLMNKRFDIFAETTPTGQPTLAQIRERQKMRERNRLEIEQRRKVA